MREVKAQPHESIEAVKEEVFGKSFFISKTKPKTAQLKERIAGTITQSRKKYWVVAKPARQVGARPKVSTGLKIDAEIWERVADKAEKMSVTKTEIVENAIMEHLSHDT